MDVDSEEIRNNYDLLVIGGGSGGLALAKEAARVDPKKKIGLFDFVVSFL